MEALGRGWRGGERQSAGLATRNGAAALLFNRSISLPACGSDISVHVHTLACLADVTARLHAHVGAHVSVYGCRFARSLLSRSSPRVRYSAGALVSLLCLLPLTLWRHQCTSPHPSTSALVLCASASLPFKPFRFLLQWCCFSAFYHLFSLVGWLMSVHVCVYVHLYVWVYV